VHRCSGQKTAAVASPRQRGFTLRDLDPERVRGAHPDCESTPRPRASDEIRHKCAVLVATLAIAIAGTFWPDPKG
jgi:hypothetical protein